MRRKRLKQNQKGWQSGPKPRPRTGSRRVESSVSVVVRFLRHRDEAAEQAVGFAVQSGGKVERVRHTGRAVIPKRNAPQTINNDGVVMGVFEKTPEVAVGFKGHDGAAAEVADEEFVLVLAEAFGSQCHAPRRVDGFQMSARVRTGRKAMELAGRRVEHEIGRA